MKSLFHNMKQVLPPELPPVSFLQYGWAWLALPFKEGLSQQNAQQNASLGINITTWPVRVCRLHPQLMQQEATYNFLPTTYYRLKTWGNGECRAVHNERISTPCSRSTVVQVSGFSDVMVGTTMVRWSPAEGVCHKRSCAMSVFMKRLKGRCSFNMMGHL